MGRASASVHNLFPEKEKKGTDVCYAPEIPPSQEIFLPFSSLAGGKFKSVQKKKENPFDETVVGADGGFPSAREKIPFSLLPCMTGKHGVSEEKACTSSSLSCSWEVRREKEYSPLSAKAKKAVPRGRRRSARPPTSIFFLSLSFFSFSHCVKMGNEAEERREERGGLFCSGGGGLHPLSLRGRVIICPASSL